ncbi:Thioredoxin domain,ERV/ALR sulfhydryl oxidase domain,Thioredoxin, conserved site,Thioredoxin-like fold [Cinara cedri]|uniref:Sulfhydryl oxidase n=1 Tax=Cinara cedri TaxID=506608 RepID=A0A5E4M1R8_9HEMI|nr:Thioredoxin domain,ERV/ALR sulfhydryl oxidase domain,Thioredoxin, conserved site,Thioredoxin-like fold [Cinara cedri]
MSISSGGRFFTVALFAVTFSVTPILTERIGLYEDTDLMEILDVNNFYDKVINGNTSFVVEFYNAFCGHCMRFATPYKEFGLQVYGWRKYVKVGVIDCSNQSNSQTCRNYEVMAYPTVRYFPPHPPSNYIGEDFFRSMNPQTMKTVLINKLIETQKNGNLSFLCDIQPYKNNLVTLDSDNLLTFVIIDTADNKVAQELIIEYCPVKKVKIIYALNNNTALVEQFKPISYPSLYRVTNNNQIVLLASGNNKTLFTEFINSDLHTAHLTPFSIIDITTKIYNMLFSRGEMPKDNAIVYLSDLEATMRYSLDHEVILRNAISGDALSALKSYLELLIEYFPTSIRGKKFLKVISEHMSNSESVSGEELGNFINKYELFLNPYVTKLKWIGCEGSHPMYRRYPCGLWTLFHTLTVQASTKNLQAFNGEQVLNTIAGYVKHFFGCTECSEHFMQMTTTIKNNVSSFDDAVLWLWSAHNQVNQRLAGDVSEDPMHPKILFPLKAHCETCRQNDEWNKTEVLAYLKRMYSTISIKQTPNDNVNIEPLNMIASKHLIDDSKYIVFDEEEWKIDVSTCMISYILSCLVLMVLFYLLVIKKRCKKNKYIYFILGKV